MFKIDIYERPVLQGERPIGTIHECIDIVGDYFILSNHHWIKRNDIRFFYEIGFDNEIPLEDNDVN